MQLRGEVYRWTKDDVYRMAPSILSDGRLAQDDCVGSVRWIAAPRV
jgi:hypothetical protein